MRHRRTTGAVATAVVLAGCTAAGTGEGAPTAARPNVIVVMTDDQSVAELAAMPRTRALIAEEGVTFERSYASFPVCAPSRATFLTGRYAHNHDVMGLYRPTGGYSRLDAGSTLPVWLREAGYETVHLGKYVNGYGTEAPATQPPGWSDWYGAIDPTTYRMWGYSLNENGRVRTYGTPRDEDPRLYQTDVLADRATEAIERRGADGRPFFMSLAFLAPHHESAGIRRQTGQVVRAAPRHAGATAARVPARSRAFDEADVSDKPAFIRRRGRIAPAVAAGIERRRGERRRALLPVDEAVERIVATLRRTGQLERTYIVFTSDNGYLQGEHRVPSGKLLAYEQSARVPLLIRGPGVPAGTRSRALVANVDLAPTIVALAGARAPVPLDGISLLGVARDPRRRPDRQLLLESGGARYAAGALVPTLSYRAIRTGRWLYVRYRGGASELYDLERDPDELHSLHADPRHAGTRRKLAAALRRLARCSGADCRGRPGGGG